MSARLVLPLFPVHETLIHRLRVLLGRDVVLWSAILPWSRAAMVFDSSTSEESPAELVTPDTSNPLSSSALCMAVMDASESCSTDTTEVTMFGETHLTCPGHESCMTALMVETQVGQCRFPRRNDVMTGPGASWPAACDDAILLNIGRLALGGSNGVLNGTWEARSATKSRSRCTQEVSGRPYWRDAVLSVRLFILTKALKGNAEGRQVAGC